MYYIKSQVQVSVWGYLKVSYDYVHDIAYNVVLLHIMSHSVP